MIQKRKSLVLLSGGIDSVVALWWAKSKGWEPATITFLFPGRRKKELQAARKCGRLSGGVQNVEVFIPFVDPPKVERSCYIPKRNFMFYAVAASLAEKIKADFIIGGHIEHDGKIFPDAKKNYLDQLGRLVRIKGRQGEQSRLLFPFIGFEKKKIVTIGTALGVPFQHTWSCSHDIEKHCWRCYSCRERKEGFQSANVRDPLFEDA